MAYKPREVELYLNHKYSFHFNPFSRFIFYLILYALKYLSYPVYIGFFIFFGYVVFPFFGFLILITVMEKIYLFKFLAGILLMIYFIALIFAILKKPLGIKIFISVFFAGAITSLILSVIYLYQTIIGIDVLQYHDFGLNIIINNKEETQELYGFGNMFSYVNNLLIFLANILFFIFSILLFSMLPDFYIKSKDGYFRSVLSVLLFITSFIFSIMAININSFAYAIKILIGITPIDMILDAWLPVVNKIKNSN